ncbi:hypothetical protein BGW36DRAFT_464032 [Talaromyces proteolyticus]|uniref:Uncharacterized protein n=1 Tax=Talaromyces proteolyticus TaxID=1131652 RepID=A0AAD4PXJ5_9EURO|nr:uncharacterized protein BGW36DRAFT_464032 [Talaromyces proteolyticus]KAH8692793.1 hypothetical protein BGW36DRAFT_464032 [Talaromyces proteolyticus]
MLIRKHLVSDPEHRSAIELAHLNLQGSMQAPQHGTKVTIKKTPYQWASRPSLWNRFLDHFRSTAAITEPNPVEYTIETSTAPAEDNNNPSAEGPRVGTRECVAVERQYSLIAFEGQGAIVNPVALRVARNDTYKEKSQGAILISGEDAFVTPPDLTDAMASSWFFYVLLMESPRTIGGKSVRGPGCRCELGEDASVILPDLTDAMTLDRLLRTLVDIGGRS